MTKLLKILFLVFCSFLAVYSCTHGQTNAAFKMYLSYNTTDTTSLQTLRNTYQSAYGNSGGLYFDKTRNKWRVWDGTQWTDLLQPAGATYTASNGITLSANNFKLGGTLSENTTINSDNYTYNVYKPDNNFDFGEASFKLDETSGVGFYSYEPSETVGTSITSLSGVLTVTDTRISKAGIQYAASGYVNTPLSLTTKEYVDAIAGSPAGSNTEVQYNNSGAFGAEAAFTYNATTNRMVVSTVNLTAAPATPTAGDIYFDLALNPDNFNLITPATFPSSNNILRIKDASGNIFFDINGNGISQGSYRAQSFGILANNSTGTDPGQSISITAGQGGTGGNTLGGNVSIQQGKKSNSGTDGTISLGRSDADPTLIRLVNIPTSSAGLTSGMIWNDAGTLKIIP